MKKILILYLFLSAYHLLGYYTPPQGPKNESIAQAKQRFERMTVRQVDNLQMCKLSKRELQAFKELAQSIFHTEIASAGCFSQANRRKYEVMYQKIGQTEQHHNKAF